MLPLCCVSLAAALSTVQPEAAALPSLSANYRQADGAVLSIGDGPSAPFFMEYATGERCPLSAGPEGAHSLPGARPLRLEGDRLSWTDAAGRAREARREPVRREEIWFAGDGAKLSGTLFLPPGEGPFPAVVLVQGSGPETREAMLQYPYFLAAHGFAALAYDKRGAGRSTGEWQPWAAGIQVLAGDALAAVRALRSRGDIAHGRVGVLGISNGAWVAIRAAASDGGVAFVIPVSGGGVPIWRSELFRVRNELREKGYAPAEVDEAVRWLGRLYDRGMLGDPDAARGAARTAKLVDEGRARRWFADTPVAPFAALSPVQAFDLGRRAYRNELSYDPERDLRSLRIPVLAIYGSNDADTPAADEEAALRRQVARPGHLQLVDVPGAGHALTLGAAPAEACRRFGPGVFDGLAAFLGRMRARPR